MGDADRVAGDAGVAAGIFHGDVLEDEMPWVLDGRHVGQVGVDDSLHVKFPGSLRPTAIYLFLQGGDLE